MDTLETIEYRGYEINVHYDHHAENPMTDSEWEPTVIYRPYQPRREGLTEYGEADYSLELTREQIRDNIGNLKMLFDVDRLIALRPLHYDFLHYSATDAINSLLHKHSEKGAAEFCEVLALCGYPCDYSSLRDGDAIAVLTPRFFEITGCENEYDANNKNLAGALRLFTSWAEGHVYGYTTTGPDDGVEGLGPDCWGFYGYGHEDSGLLEHAKSDIDYCIKEQIEENERAQQEATARLTENMRAGFALFPKIPQLV